MPAPQIILDLVERFEEHRDAYHAGSYSEAELRTEFIDPLFEALGWDIANKEALAEQYKDVVREASVEVEGQAKKPDYEFRIGGTRKFYVEAKKPSVNLKNDIGPAFQLRRYAWSAKLPLGITTDFEEMAIYDCRTKPKATDAAGIGRVHYYTYKDYTDKWVEIAGIFSKDAILHGAFDKYAVSDKKRGTQTVDEAFLKEIESWRVELARNIAIRNGQLTVDELNYAVQQTIDRVIFLRICEDRGIESYGDLQKIVSGADIYKSLLKHFLYADERYNSGLFHFKKEKDNAEEPDDLTPSLRIDDKVLKEIVKGLYPPESPYEFSVIAADILGQVYERFLGKVIRLTAGHQAKVEDKPEVKKAGGVYYTPTYIVDYIVNNTVGKLVENKTPAQVDKLKILDPACGSGSFLIGAYQFLLDWYLEYYSTHDPVKLTKGANPKLNQADGGGWKLTLPERRRILLNNIHGVDIDGQAVEVTKLSLYLKVLEGVHQIALDRVLPDLSANIKCGNSLVGTDYFIDKLIIDPEEMSRINAMDWDQAFPEIMMSGGFDAVIGNPPYIRIQVLKDGQAQVVDFLRTHYDSAAAGNYDLYIVFIEKGLSLLRSHGLLGYITPHKFFNASYGEALRRNISSEKHLAKVVHFGEQQIFTGATTYCCLLFLSNDPKNVIEFQKVDNVAQWAADPSSEFTLLDASVAVQDQWNFESGALKPIFSRLSQKTMQLGALSKIFVGTQTSADDVFVLEKSQVSGDVVTGFSKHLGRNVTVEVSATRPFVRGKEIRKYSQLRPSARVIFPYSVEEELVELLSLDRLKEKYPMALEYLSENRQALAGREKGRFDTERWYAFGYPKSMDLFEKEKLVVPDYNNEASATLDSDGNYFKTGYGIIKNDESVPFKYLLALLNSSLLFRYLESISTGLRGGYIRFWTQYLEKLPIVIPSQENLTITKSLISLAGRRMDLTERVADTPQSLESLQRQIDATDREIDQLVYDLYGLTAEEIKIVEEAT